MAREYPSIGQTRDMRRKWTVVRKGVPVPVGPRCVACEAHATHRVDVQVNWFRGDDVVVNACEQHRRDPAALLKLS